MKHIGKSNKKEKYVGNKWGIEEKILSSTNRSIPIRRASHGLFAYVKVSIVYRKPIQLKKIGICKVLKGNNEIMCVICLLKILDTGLLLNVANPI